MLEKSKFIFEILESNGFECYAVGGCVRDFLSGRDFNDIDFTTNATPDEILDCFKDYKTIELGKKYGTISVLHNNEIYEITTFRTDGKYTDSRHPDKVIFSNNLIDDLSRRDFTINAMAMDKNGNITDAFMGMSDLNNKVIRAVGNPEKRFSEDALRILRALRFSAKLGFIIEPETAEACKSKCDLLKKVHPQRIRDELSELMTVDNTAEVMSEYRDVLGVIIPELKSTFDYKLNSLQHCYDLYNHTVNALRFAPIDPEIRFSLLFHDIGKPFAENASSLAKTDHAILGADIAKEILRRFGFNSKFISSVCNIIKYHGMRFDSSRVKIKKALKDISVSDFNKLITVMICDVKAQSEYMRQEKLAEIRRLEELFNVLVNENLCVNIKDLAVNGNDLSQTGLSGKEIGDTLSVLLDLVIEEKLINDKEVLLSYIKENIAIDN